MKFHELIHQDLPVIIDFYADWCAPCKAVSPTLDKLKEEYGDQIKIYKIDVDKNANLSEKYQVMAIPTLMIFKSGKILWRVSGVASLGEIKGQLAKVI